MLCSINNLKGFDLVTTGGEIGDVKQFFFDDERWTIRYLVVNTGDWVAEQQVLISPFAVTRIDYDNRKLHVALTKTQVESGPDIDTHQPVSRQMEATYSDYYNYPYYWRSPLLWGASVSPDLAASQTPATLRMATSVAAEAMAHVVPPEIHLHSTQEVVTYHIAATDGLIGYVNGFLVDDASWSIRYLVIDTGNWLLGRKVMVGLHEISSINKGEGEIQVNLSRDAIRQSPEYDSTKLLARAHGTQPHRHYGQSKTGLDHADDWIAVKADVIEMD